MWNIDFPKCFFFLKREQSATIKARNLITICLQIHYNLIRTPYRKQTICSFRPNLSILR